MPSFSKDGFHLLLSFAICLNALPFWVLQVDTYLLPSVPNLLNYLTAFYILVHLFTQFLPYLLNFVPYIVQC